MTTKQIFNTSAELDYPTVLPTLDLDFVNTKTLDPRISFTRSSGGSYVGADGLIKYAGVNQPRFDHNPVTGESLGLLIEESRTNFCTYSNNFTGADWSNAGIGATPTITSNATISPDGTNNASLYEAPVVGTFYYWRNGAATIGTAVRTFSIFCKAAGTGFVSIRCFSGQQPFEAFATFNLYNGTVVTNGPMTASVIPYPNGWYRCIMTRTDGNDKQPYNFHTTGYVSFYIWGAQLEAGSFPTSYIPTQASAVTRAADVPTISGSRLTSWYNYYEGTFYGEVNFSGTLKNTFTSILNVNGNGNNSIMSAAIGTSAVPTKVAVGLLNFNSLNWTPVGKAERFLSKVYRLGSFIGLPIIYDGPYPYIFHLGYNPGAPAYLNGTISRITYWPKRLPDAQLQALSTY